MKTKKRKKSSRMHGRKMGTHGTGARKKAKKTGHRGGKGMAGSGKRADHKKTLITKLYGGKYFGKQGITSRGTQKDKENRINLQEIEKNIEKYGKKTTKGFEINLKSYKILGTGEVKSKLIIKAKEASKSAIEKVKKAGGEIILPIKKEMIVLKEKQKVESAPKIVASLKETKNKEKK
ncbi:uL15 family ribosomal protein [Candidatus Pacearchaeota archaeon]|nr:uL15 family ribosomal protein [Candidatus Pacearchaeota archaeon]